MNVKLTWHRRQLHLRHPFNIARVDRSGETRKEVLLVRIEHESQVGWGEAAPIRYYHQSLDSAEAALARAAGLLGASPFRLEEIHERLWKEMPDQSAAIAAVDGALHDLIGKLLRIPVWRMFGLSPEKVPLTSFTIGIDDMDTVARKVREAQEYPILKIKVGTPDDEMLLRTVRAAAPDKVLRVDANCGWTPENALERMRMVAGFHVEFIEQPIPAGNLEAVAVLRNARVAPLFADEDSVTEADVVRCAGRYDGINIKLSKCGGIRPALRMIHAARALGLKIMLGCMVETSVGIAAAAQLAPLVDYVDLDGHLLLADDPFEGIGGARGILTLNDDPGLGIRERTG
jgi:L-alanine-DL-glutamate epimerase-like enolase superfamily enzyme